MCRNIRPLHNFEPPATEDEVATPALQYVRKISGFNKPSQANEEAFERAVDEVAAATRELLDALVTTAPPKDREVEAAKARARVRPALRGLGARPRSGVDREEQERRAEGEVDAALLQGGADRAGPSSRRRRP